MNLNISCVLFVLCFGVVCSSNVVLDFLKQQHEVVRQQQTDLQKFLQENLETAKKQAAAAAAAGTSSSSSFQTAYQTNYAYRYGVVTQEYPPAPTAATVTNNANHNAYNTATAQAVQSQAGDVQSQIPNPPANTHININRNTNPNANANSNPITRSVSTRRPSVPIFNNNDNTFTSRISLQNGANENFCHNLFQALVPPAQGSNIVYSPASLEMLLAFISTGASGPTLQELQSALKLPNGAREVATTYQQVLHSVQAGGNQVVMSNKVYYSPQLELKTSTLPSFARDYFDSDIESVNFASPPAAAQKINNWVAQKTQNRITNVIAPIAIDPNTEALLVNAIYFKGKWEKPFSMSETRQANFHISRDYAVPVNMMYNEEIFRYNEIPQLQASVLELPYENSDLTMLIILPFENATLGQVERNLNQMDLAVISASLKRENVHVRIPRFNIDFEQDMSQTLQMLGIRYLFSDQADLSMFFKSQKPVVISKVQHKAHITVNEAGSEAAASSFASFVPLSLPAREILFTADRPFMFAIRNPRAVFFMGHVVSL